MFPDLQSPDLKVISDFPFDVIDEPTIWIPVSDNVRLSARVWRPNVLHRVPVVVEIIPYRHRDGTLPVDERIHPFFAGHGIAAVRVDLRGSGDSDGILVDEYLPQEQDDAVAVIEWAAKQPWSNGNVGMTGLSWGGFGSLHAAARNPDALKAIVAIGATVDRYNDDVHYKNGCLLNENFGWGTSLTAFTTRPPDPMAVGEKWRSIWLDRLENLNFFAAKWFEHQTYDDYWKHGSVRECFEDIEVPVMIVSGWNDLYVNALPELLENLKGRCHAVCGPWAHHFPHLGTPGPSYDYLGDALAWWQRWLNDDAPTGDCAKTHLAFIKDSSFPNPSALRVPGRWIEEKEWPSPSIIMSQFFLADGVLVSETVDAPALDVHSAVETGYTAGEWVPHCSGLEINGCQSQIDGQSTCFDGDTLHKPIEILGRPEFSLSLKSDAPTGQLIVRLCDISPDGSSELVSIGMVNLAHRNGNEHIAPMPVGENQKIHLKLDHTAHRFLPGHRVRLALSTAYWPFVWPEADNPVLTLGNSPAILSLPVRSHQDDEAVELDQPVAPSPSDLSEHRSATSVRRFSFDQEQGLTILEIHDDLGEITFNCHGLTTSAVKSERYSIATGDPLSSEAHIGWEFEYSRSDWKIRTSTETTMTCDRHHYFLSATVIAFENDNCVFQRDFSHKIRRVTTPPI